MRRNAILWRCFLSCICSSAEDRWCQMVLWGVLTGMLPCSQAGQPARRLSNEGGGISHGQCILKHGFLMQHLLPAVAQAGPASGGAAASPVPGQMVQQLGKTHHTRSCRASLTDANNEGSTWAVSQSASLRWLVIAVWPVPCPVCTAKCEVNFQRSLTNEMINKMACKNIRNVEHNIIVAEGANRLRSIQNAPAEESSTCKPWPKLVKSPPKNPRVATQTEGMQYS